MFDKLSDNLNFLMVNLHISADELARRTGIPASTIKKIRNRYNPNPTLSTLIPIAEFFAVTLGQLAGIEPLPTQHSQSIPTTAGVSLRHIPLISWEAAITACPQHNSDCSYIAVTNEHAFSEKTFALRVIENDWDNLVAGTIIFVDPALEPAHRDVILIYKIGQQPTLKQVLFDEGQFYLKPLVQGYQITPLTPDHQIVGVVVEYKKQLRKPHSISN